MRTVLIATLLLLASLASASAQTPKVVTIENPTITKSWTITGYELGLTNPANPASAVIAIKYVLVTKVADQLLATEHKSTTVVGDGPVTGLIADVDARVRKLIAADDANAFYNATRDALYAWLQANGHIDANAE